MENMVDRTFYRNKKILITGHTGFKGSWLTLWLQQMGASVCGISLPPDTTPNLFTLLNVSAPELFNGKVPSTPQLSNVSTAKPSQFLNTFFDINKYQKVLQAIKKFQPDIIFHMAAQPLVRKSYHEPLETLNTNIIGTANILEACRHVDAVRAVVCITSDKCYENQELTRGYRESDPMGGYDPYSTSKGCAELVISSYRRSFFNPKEYGSKHQTLIASARAGNVIGGGDWGEDRLIPDIVRAIQDTGKVTIRNPQACRPWQHVLEPLSGYLLLGQRLLEGATECARGWNFGPGDAQLINVEKIVKLFKARWDVFTYEVKTDDNQPHEAGLLRLDCSLARQKLGWHPVWSVEKALNRTVEWYKRFYDDKEILCSKNLHDYLGEVKC